MPEIATPFFRRNRTTIFVCLGFVAGFAAYGAFLAVQNTSNQITDWLPAEFEETQTLLEFASQFGSEEFVMVSWSDCTVDDPRVIRMAEQLRKPATIDGQRLRFFDPVLTGPEILEDLQAEPLNLRRSTALRRLQGVLTGEDQETTCIVLALADSATVDRHQAIDFIRDCADQVEGLSGETIHLAGTTVDSVMIDEASQKIVFLSLLAYTVSLLLAVASFRHLGLAIIVFVTAVLNQQITLALVHYSGWHMDTVLLMAPPLVYVLSISAGVHLVNYYRDAVRERGLVGAPERAVRLGLAPCLMAAVTTSMGLVALQASYLVPLQRFGIYAAGGVLLGTCVLLLLIPSCLSQWPARRWAATHRHTGGATMQPNGRWDRFLAFVSSGRYPILVVVVALLLVGGRGVQEARGTAFLHDMFSPDARIVQDYDWLESHIGPLIPVEVVLHTPKFPEEIQSYETPMLDLMNWVGTMQAVIASVDDIDATVSALTFAPTIPRGRVQGLRMADRIRRTTLEKTLRRRRAEFIRLGYLRELPDELWWRISGHVPAGRRADYDVVMRDLNDKLAPVLAAAQRRYPQASLAICGGLPLVQKAQQQMVADLITSFTVAFALITGAMVVLMWALSFRDMLAATSATWRVAILAKASIAGSLAMIPNVLPCLVAFGAMGWLKINVEIGTVMTAAAAMGIAVDDTVHFIVWFRRGSAQGLSQRDAARFAYQRCGSAMIQTTLICGLGLLVFAASPFGPTTRFAWLMFMMLMMALLADLIVLSALLVSPLGRLFSTPPQPVEPVKPVHSVA